MTSEKRQFAFETTLRHLHQNYIRMTGVRPQSTTQHNTHRINSYYITTTHAARHKHDKIIGRRYRYAQRESLCASTKALKNAVVLVCVLALELVPVHRVSLQIASAAKLHLDVHADWLRCLCIPTREFGVFATLRLRVPCNLSISNMSWWSERRSTDPMNHSNFSIS